MLRGERYRDLDTDTDSPSETTARVTDPWIMIIRGRQIDRKLSTFRHILNPLPFFSIHAYTFSTYILSFGQIGSQHEYEVKRGICRLSSIYVQVDSMGFYFQQTRFQMPGSPYRRGKVCRSNVSQAGYDTERVQWVHLLGWNSWMARGTRVSRKKGRKEGRKKEEGLSGFIFAAVFISLRSCYCPSTSSRFPSSHTRIESVNFSTTDPFLHFTLRARRTRDKPRNIFPPWKFTRGIII